MKLHDGKMYPNETKPALLDHYAAREPRRFHQIDGWLENDDDLIGRDADGDGMMGGGTTELMHGSDCRILIPDENAHRPGDIARLLRKAADWVERGAMNAGAA